MKTKSKNNQVSGLQELKWIIIVKVMAKKKKQNSNKFFKYFKDNGYHIHRGLLPTHTDFVRTLREELDDKAKSQIYTLYLDATHKQPNPMPRDYIVEYALLGSRKKQREKNKLRQANRLKFEKLGLVMKGDKKEIHHIDGNPLNNRHNNLKVVGVCAHNILHGKQCVRTKKKKKRKRE